MDGREDLSQDERCDGHVDDSRVLDAASWISAEAHDEDRENRRKILSLCQRCGDVELWVTNDSLTLLAYFLYPRSLVEVVKADVFDDIEEALGGVLYVGEMLHVVDLVVVSPRKLTLRKLADPALRTWRPEYVTMHRRGEFRMYKQRYGGRLDG